MTVKSKVVIKYKRGKIAAQLTINIVDKMPAVAILQKLANGERFQNWATQEAPIVFKK
jgi:hypothetical protein